MGRCARSRRIDGALYGRVVSAFNRAMTTRTAWLGLTLLAACSGTTPLQLSAWEDAQLFAEDAHVLGARFGLFAVNDEVHGLDVDLLWSQARRASGIAIAPAIGATEFTGLQVGGWTTTGHLTGVSLAVYNNPFGGFLADGKSTHDGIQVGLAMNVAQQMAGVQLGTYNVAEELVGVQVGLFNESESGGLQIGLLNWKEDGFLPVFPLVNF